MDWGGVGEQDSYGQSVIDRIRLPGRRQAWYAAFLAIVMVTSVIVPFVAMTGPVVATPGNSNGPPQNPVNGNGPPDDPGNGNGPAENPGNGNGPPDNPGNGNGPPTETPGGAPTPTPSPTPMPTPGENETTNVSETTPSVLDAVPVLQHYRAVRLSANLTGGQSDRAHERLNDSLQYHSGPVRLNDSHAFTLDAQAIRSLASANETGNATRAAELVYQADNTTATTAVADARRVLERFGDDMANQGRRNAAEQHLRNAERALDRGQDVADDEQFFQSRAQALNHLRQAHRHAQRAMRFVDAETTPEVAIATERDPVWDGNGTRQYSIRGNLTTVRPSTISNVTVTVNGNRTVQAQTGLSLADPGTNASYRATVNLTERVNRITVTVTDGASDGGNQPGQQDTAVLRVDGDGLPESYETETVGTDPLDPDSDSDVTSADEADNGTIDGREDFDGDRLTTIEEFELGTDPHDADTDDDTLTDSQEVVVVGMDPLNSDSDADVTDANESDNGIEDGAEDLDGDGLTNAEEFANGSSPLYVDGDADGLTDPEELDLGTDPLDPDTDEDGLRDALELEEPFTTDPLDEDTDDDGVLDGNETYTTSVTNESVDATIEVTGPGHAAAGASVRNETQPGLRNDLITPALLSEYVTYSDVDDPSNSSLVLGYDEAALPTNESDLAMYRLNRTTGVLERLDSTVDAVNDTVRAPAPTTFGTVGILSPSVLDEQIPDAGEIDDNAVNRTTFTESDISECEGECSIEDGSLTVGPLAAEEPSQTQSLAVTSADPQLLSTNSFSSVVDTISVPGDAAEATVTVSINADPDGSGGGAGVTVGGSQVYSIGSQASSESVSRSTTVSVSGGGTIEVFKSGSGVDLSVSVTNVQFFDAQGNPIGGGGDDGDHGTEDLCEPVAGTQDIECPDSSVSTVSIPVEGSVARIEIDAVGQATVVGDNSSATLSASGVASRSETVTSNGTLSAHWSFTNLSPSGGSDELTLEVSTTGLAGVQLDDVRIWKDTDGDGFSDKREEVSGFHGTMFGRLTTDADSADTDGDGLADDVEISHRADPGSHAYGVPWVLNSHPARVDGDGDGLDDDEELNGLSLSIMERPEGGYYDLADGSHTNGEIQVNPNPLAPDTDGDGLNDGPEVEYFNTDPTADVTYEITEEHQAFIDAMEGERRLAINLDIIDGSAPCLLDCTEVGDLELDDGSDDFDFVMTDGSSPRDRVTFTALDGTERTDQWLNSTEELEYGTDPWDPDTDDDGLTDGQEAVTITHYQTRDVRPDLPLPDPDVDYEDLNPTAPDTDGDGYWDGWIGVYGVGRTDNVVLYRHNLRDEVEQVVDGHEIYGVQGDETVDEQALVHEVSGNTPGIEVDGYSGRVHSRTHIGELLWGSSPTGDSEPDTSLSIEVDYYQEVPYESLDESEWEETIERNFQLYGIDVELIPDEVVAREQGDPDNQLAWDLSNGMSVHGRGSDVGGLYAEYGENSAHSTDEYMFVGPRNEYGPDLGVNSLGHAHMALHLPRIQDELEGTTLDLEETPYETQLQAISAHTAIHEIGHSFLLGETDDGERDDCGDEVNTNSECDVTPEFVSEELVFTSMSAGAEQEMEEELEVTGYYMITIEEMVSITEP